MKKIGISFQLRWLKILSFSIILFLVGLGIGISASFPAGILEKRLIHLIEQEGQVSIAEGNLGFGFVHLDGHNLLIQPQDGNITPLRVDQATVSPLWGTLFSNNPGVHVDAQLFAGNLNADLFKDGHIKATAKNLMLEFPLQNGWSLNLTGQLVSADLESLIPLSKASESHLNLVLNQVSLREEGKEKNMLSLGTIDLEAKGKGQAFRITKLAATDGDFEISGRGNLRLGNSPSNSTISLRVSISPTETADPGLVELLKLAAKEKGNGQYELRVSGNLSHPSVH